MAKHKWLFFSLCIGLAARLYGLTEVPVALHGDELGAGYNAYSLLKTGKDEYGLSWPLSFRQNISPLNFYLMIPFVAVFGLTEIAVRLPGVIWGMGSILATYLLVKELFVRSKWKVSILNSQFSIPELTALLLAVSPWHIQASRIAHDATLGLLVEVVAMWVFLKGLKNNLLMTLAFLLFGVSIYAYHAPKVATPLLLMGLLYFFRVKWWPKRKIVFAGVVLFLLLAAVWMVQMARTPIGNNRLVGVSILVRDETLWPVLSSISPATPFWVRILFYNPGFIYGWTFLRQYFSYLNPDYLFFDTSLVRYFQVSRAGLLYLWDVPFLLLGLLMLLKRPSMQNKFLWWWLVVAPIPGAVTLGPPNAGRIIAWLPVLMMTIAMGVASVPRKYWLLLSFLLIVNSGFFAHQYFTRSRLEFPWQWGYGLKEAVRLGVEYESRVKQVVMSAEFKQPYIYLLFYGHPDPMWLQLSPKKRHPTIGYQQISQWGFREIDWQKDRLVPNTLFIGTDEEIPASAAGLRETITAPNGQPIIRIALTGE